MSVTRDGDGPREGDRVRVIPKPFEGELKCDGSQGRLVQVRDDAGRLNAFGPDYATVEVLERADDPSKDPLDTVRVAPDGTIAVRMHVSRNGDRYTPGWRLLRGCVEMHDNGVVGWRIVGSLSEIVSADNLPDWERELIEKEAASARPSVRVVNEPNGFSVEDRQKIADYLLSGEYERAVTAAFNRGFETRAAAVEYITGMSEYQSYLSEHGETREPRVFMSDGPEPPPDVVKLEAEHDLVGWTHLERDGDIWRWSNEDGRAFGAQRWERCAPRPIKFREVLS